MDSYKIRLGHTDSVNDVDKENLLAVNLTSTAKSIRHNNIKATIDQYELSKKEMSECTKYRIILTINPYCTNVLFNPLTEISKVNDNGSINRYYNNESTANGIDGNDTPKRIQMVCNTEFSKISQSSNADNNYGYTYMPGFDIFDNHILRNKSFKVVEPLGSTNSDTKVFNTIADFYRDANKTSVKFMKRYNLSDKPTSKQMHLYTSDDVLSFEESVNANLTDENGWFGFINSSSIKTVGTDGKSVSNFNKVINYQEGCDFIDMYPDRKAFTFSPFYNKSQKRLEYNWDIFVTYAYDKDECNPLVSNTAIKNALSVIRVVEGTGISGETIFIFRCYTKHNLKRGDMIRVFKTETGDDGVETSTQIGIYRVSNTGDTDKGNSDYYFYVDGFDVPGEIVNCNDIRIRKVYNGMDSSYYVRKLKKIKKSSNGVESDLGSERYKLAFASTIYDDDTTQITFTDDIDVEGLSDNLGRPITELFITIVKTNAGNEKWYSDSDTITQADAKKIEISHCFGKLTAGFILSHEKSDYSQSKIQKKIEWMLGANVINNNNKFGSNRKQIEVPSEDEDFLCDVVEFSPEDGLEHVLSDCAYRFNTYQREHAAEITDKFIYHEIYFDDYDVPPPSVSDSNFIIKNESDMVNRDEGYYYKANYPIPIRNLGPIVQAGHREIRIKYAKIIYNGMISVSITSAISSGVSTNDIVYICDDVNGKKFEFICTGVKTPMQFTMIPNNAEGWAWFKRETMESYGGDGGGDGFNWLDLVNLINNKKFKLRGRNKDIPKYAVKVSHNLYMWRDVLPPSQNEIGTDDRYTFANGSFYLTPIIRFYLKRQDPDSTNGLQEKEVFPNDLFGNIVKQSNYYYEDEPQDLC